MKKIFGGVAKLTQCLEPKLCVLLFVFCRLQKDCRDLLVARLLCDGREIRIFVSCLRFPRERFPEIFLGLCSCVRILCGSRYLLKFGSGLLANGTLEVIRQLSLMNITAHGAFPLFH